MEDIIKRFKESFDSQEEIKKARLEAGRKIYGISSTNENDILKKQEVIKIADSILEQAERERLEHADQEAKRGIQYFRDRIKLTNEILNERFTI